jgi:hypothetical protein
MSAISRSAIGLVDLPSSTSQSSRWAITPNARATLPSNLLQVPPQSELPSNSEQRSTSVVNRSRQRIDMSQLIEPGTRVKSCTECRQHKVCRSDIPVRQGLAKRLQLRCDALQKHGKPCSRCGRLKIQCIVRKSFKRVRKRT